MKFPVRFALVLALAFGPQSAIADQQAKPPAAGAAPKSSDFQMSAVALTVIIKDAIIALHQANMTGNYSVLRDMGSPVFRENFDQTRLGGVFANLRARQIDLSPAYFLSPNLSKQPELNKDSELMLTGFFPTQPLQIQFELRFMQLDGKWRLAGIGVDAVAPSAAMASAAPAPSSPTPAPAAAAPSPASTQQAASSQQPAPTQKPASSQNAKKATGKPKPEPSSQTAAARP